MLYEAAALHDQRVLEIDEVRILSKTPGMVKGGRLKVVDPFSFHRGVDADGWQVQNADKLKKKLKRTIIQELSRKDVMPDDRVAAVSNDQRSEIDFLLAINRSWFRAPNLLLTEILETMWSYMRSLRAGKNYCLI